MTPPPHSADLLIVGGGPAGCAAALTAASVGMRSLLIEQDTQLCGKLRHIPALNNVLGGFRAGPDLAAAITGDLATNPKCKILTNTRVTAVTVHDIHVTVTLGIGTDHTAPYAVLATGVGPVQPADASWISASRHLRLQPLWEADPAQATGRTWLIVGADRPLGTFLRAHPDLDIKLLVPHPLSDAYKAEEVAGDPRVTLIPTHHLTLHTDGTAVIDGRAHQADAAYTNIGSTAIAPDGPARDASGYCPPALQHPWLITAGDLRSPRNQRIMAAAGSGTEAALRAYYATRRIPR